MPGPSRFLFVAWLTHAPTRFAARLGRGVRRLFLGRRFSVSLERNRAAADRLDQLMKEIFEQ